MSNKEVDLFQLVDIIENRRFLLSNNVGKENYNNKITWLLTSVKQVTIGLSFGYSSEFTLIKKLKEYL